VLGVTQAGLTGTTLAPINAKQSASSWTPKFGLNWQMTPDVFAYASVSRGFQAGGFNYLAVVNAEAYERGFRPQTVWAYEVGVKTSFLDRRGRLNLAAFRNDFNDIHTNVVINGSALTQNAGTARVQGIEAELSLSPIPELTFFGNLSYNDDKYLKLDPASSAAAANAQHLPNVPHWQWGGGFSSHIPVQAGEILLGGDIAYRGDQYLSGNNAPITLMEANLVANAFVGFKPAGTNLDIRASVANLFGEEYYVYGNVLANYGLRSPGDPRTFKISAQYRF
jgi:iron complex outermembrane receptor protein